MKPFNNVTEACNWIIRYAESRVTVYVHTNQQILNAEPGTFEHSHQYKTRWKDGWLFW